MRPQEQGVVVVSWIWVCAVAGVCGSAYYSHRAAYRNTYSAAQVCPLSFKMIGDRCYFYGYFRLNWYRAMEFCHSFGDGVSLASIETRQENDDLKTWLLKHGDHSTGVWVGGSDNGHKGRWSWFPTGRLIHWFDWGPSQPSGGDQRCMYIVGGFLGYQWADFHCGFEMTFMCEYMVNPANPWKERKTLLKYSKYQDNDAWELKTKNTTDEGQQQDTGQNKFVKSSLYGRPTRPKHQAQGLYNSWSDSAKIKWKQVVADTHKENNKQRWWSKVSQKDEDEVMRNKVIRNNLKRRPAGQAVAVPVLNRLSVPSVDKSSNKSVIFVGNLLKSKEQSERILSRLDNSSVISVELEGADNEIEVLALDRQSVVIDKKDKMPKSQDGGENVPAGDKKDGTKEAWTIFDFLKTIVQIPLVIPLKN